MSLSTNRLRISRLLIGIVLLLNLQCAVAFLAQPNKYAPAYELVGIPGQSAIQGFGVLFIMWNVPYVLALAHPQKNRLSLYEAISMQAIGLVGEFYILWRLPPEHYILAQSIGRFIIFDGSGLVALLISGILTYQKPVTSSHIAPG